MRALCISSSAISLRLIVFALFGLFGFAGYAAAATCNDYARYTIKITNDTGSNPAQKKYNIFPVLDTPTNGPDEWLQAGFNVPDGDRLARPYTHKFKYRMYFKPLVGLAPGKLVSVTLPLCSQLLVEGTTPAPIPMSTSIGGMAHGSISTIVRSGLGRRRH